MSQAEEKGICVCHLLSSLLTNCQVFQQLSKVFGRTLASTMLQLLYLPILSPDEKFIFYISLPETDNIHLIWTWSNFLQNENSKTVIPSVSVASVFLIAGPSISPFFPLPLPLHKQCPNFPIHIFHLIIFQIIIQIPCQMTWPKFCCLKIELSYQTLHSTEADTGWVLKSCSSSEWTV